MKPISAFPEVRIVPKRSLSTPMTADVVRTEGEFLILKDMRPQEVLPP